MMICNPRYILLSRFRIWCYQVDTFPNLQYYQNGFEKPVVKSQVVHLDGSTCTNAKFEENQNIKSSPDSSCVSCQYKNGGSRMVSDHL